MNGTNVNIGSGGKIAFLFDPVNAYFYLKRCHQMKLKFSITTMNPWIGKVKTEYLSVTGKPLLMIGYRTF